MSLLNVLLTPTRVRICVMGTLPVPRGINAAAPAVDASAVETLREGGTVSVHRFSWACAFSTACLMLTAKLGKSAASQAVAASVSRQFCYP